MRLNRCRCGQIPKMVMKLPEKHELCRVVCPCCGAKTDLFMADYHAAAVWNSLMQNHSRSGRDTRPDA